MLVVNYLRQNLDTAKELLAKRPGLDVALVDQIIQLDDDRKSIQHQLDETLAEMNKASKEIGMLFKSGQREEANALKELSLIHI